jgi:DNA-binding transcriptional MerR regulator
MTKPERFTAEQLAFRAGVPLRTVRYYVAEKLIDAPQGRGRGAHFTEHHLVQLQQARTLQNAGFDLAAIRERRGDLTVGLQAMAQWDAWRGRLGRKAGDRPPADEDLDPVECLRIPMADGVELMVHESRRLPSPKQLVELALQVRRIFGER